LSWKKFTANGTPRIVLQDGSGDPHLVFADDGGFTKIIGDGSDNDDDGGADSGRRFILLSASCFLAHDQNERRERMNES